MYERYAREYQNVHRQSQMTASGFDPAHSQQALRAVPRHRARQEADLPAGAAYYYFPGLPQIQFYEREHFPWLDALERETDDIRAELLEVMQAAGGVRAVCAGEARTVRRTSRRACSTIPRGAPSICGRTAKSCAENAARCPRTMEALRDAAAGARAESLAVDPVLVAQARRAHSAAQRPGEHAA